MEKQRIVDAHNKVRQMIALGKIPGQPAATNMKEMIWDSELAVIAQRWADQCMPGHDHRRNVGEGGGEGGSWWPTLNCPDTQTGTRWVRTSPPPGATAGPRPAKTSRSSGGT